MTTTYCAETNRVPAAAQAAARRMAASESPILTSHVRLDGDAIASELALAHSLAAMGKRPSIVHDGDIPKVFEFLPGISRFVRETAGSLQGDLAVILDCPTRKRIGKVAERLPMTADIVRIDHHRSEERVGDLEWVDASASSVGEMLFEMMTDQGWPISPEVATCLYVAIVTDTGRLSFPNTSPRTVHVCARLMEAGADHVGANDALYRSEDWELMQLRAEAVQGMKRAMGGKVVVMRLTREMLGRYGVNPLDIQEFADIPRAVTGVRVGVFLREMSTPGMVKISLRGCGNADLRPVAREFGGGGHAEAAGCETQGDLDAVEAKVLDALGRHVEL